MKVKMIIFAKAREGFDFSKMVIFWFIFISFLVFDMGLVNPAGTWIRVPRVWIPMTIFVNYAISVPVSIEPAPAIAGLA